MLCFIATATSIGVSLWTEDLIYLLGLLILPVLASERARQIVGMIALVVPFLLTWPLARAAELTKRRGLILSSLLVFVLLGVNTGRLYFDADNAKMQLEADITALYEQVLDRYSIGPEGKGIIGDYLSDIGKAYAAHPHLLENEDPCDRDVRESLCALYGLDCFASSLEAVRKKETFDVRTRQLLIERSESPNHEGDRSCEIRAWKAKCSPRYEMHNAIFYATLHLRVAGEGFERAHTACAHHAWQRAFAADQRSEVKRTADSFLMTRLPGLVYAHYVEGYQGKESIVGNKYLLRDFSDFNLRRDSDCEMQSNELNLKWTAESALCWYRRAIKIYTQKKWKYPAPTPEQQRDKERWIVDLAIRFYGVMNKDSPPADPPAALREHLRVLEENPNALLVDIGKPASPHGYLNMAQVGALAYEKRAETVDEDGLTEDFRLRNEKKIDPYHSLMLAIDEGYTDSSRFKDLRRAKLCGLLRTKHRKATLALLSSRFGAAFNPDEASRSCDLSP
jgi:hypothetical protein